MGVLPKVAEALAPGLMAPSVWPAFGPLTSLIAERKSIDDPTMVGGDDLDDDEDLDNDEDDDLDDDDDLD